MPAIAHVGVGFAAKRYAPDVPVIYLILAAEFIEIMFFVFVLSGLERMPEPDSSPYAPFSHSVIMGVIWSMVIGSLTYLISKNQRTSIIIALLAFSHTVLDIIASPKLAFYPTDTAMPIFFDTSLSIGLGLFKYSTAALAFEFGFLFLGIVIYILTRRKLRQRKNENSATTPVTFKVN
jgi:TctA family transporter